MGVNCFALLPQRGKRLFAYQEARRDYVKRCICLLLSLGILRSFLPVSTCPRMGRAPNTTRWCTLRQTFTYFNHVKPRELSPVVLIRDHVYHIRRRFPKIPVARLWQVRNATFLYTVAAAVWLPLFTLRLLTPSSQLNILRARGRHDKPLFPERAMYLKMLLRH